jgi:hypothetical protein
MTFGIAVLAFSLSIVGADQTVVSSCAGCHPTETKLHEATRMAHAMVPATSSAFGQNLPAQPLEESPDGYRFIYRRVDKGLDVRAMLGESQSEGLIEWVLGAGAQGQTPLIRSPIGFLESRVSYFPQLHRYGITVGQQPGTSAAADKALGWKQNKHDLQNCIGCHSTVITRDLEPVVPGVQCQRCHLGADEHARGKGLPLNPGRLKPAAQVQFCGNCHRSKPPVDDTQLENVRFQPLRLMKSRCFASGKLACTTCHPAHRDARRNSPDFYNDKCRICHESGQAHSDQRQTGDCIGCHMPYVELHPALRFTDHYIRVVKAGDLPDTTIRKRGATS